MMRSAALLKIKQICSDKTGAVSKSLELFYNGVFLGEEVDLEEE